MELPTESPIVSGPNADGAHLSLPELLDVLSGESDQVNVQRRHALRRELHLGGYDLAQRLADHGNSESLDPPLPWGGLRLFKGAQHLRQRGVEALLAHPLDEVLVPGELAHRLHRVGLKLVKLPEVASI